MCWYLNLFITPLLIGYIQVPIPIHHYKHSTGYPGATKCFTIVDRELQGVIRNIKEAM